MLVSAFVTVVCASVFIVGSGIIVIISSTIMAITIFLMIMIHMPTNVTVVAVVANIYCASNVVTGIDMIVVVVVALIVTVTIFQGSPHP